MKYKSSSRILVSVLALFASLLTFTQVQAEIFKCEDGKGKVFYNDKPCAVNDKETRIKAVVTPKQESKSSNLIEDTQQESRDARNKNQTTEEADHEFALKMERERGGIPFDDEPTLK